MGTIDLSAATLYDPVNHLTPQQRFDLACVIARALHDVRVRVAVSDDGADTVILDGRLLSRSGAEVY